MKTENRFQLRVLGVTNIKARLRPGFAVAIGAPLGPSSRQMSDPGWASVSDAVDSPQQAGLRVLHPAHAPNENLEHCVVVGF